MSLILLLALAQPEIKLLLDIPAHPITGQHGRQGAISALGFLGGGKYVVVGGNDTKVRVFRIDDGKRVFRSKSLNSAIRGISTCAGRTFAVQTLHGQVHLFRKNKKGKRFKKLRTISHKGGETMGLVDSCKWVLADKGEEFFIYEAHTGKRRGLFEAHGPVDRRAMKIYGKHILSWGLGAGVRVNIIDSMVEGPEEGARLEIKHSLDKRALTQAWYFAYDRILTEYCAESACEIVLRNGIGRSEKRILLKVKSSGLDPQKPSTLAISKDAAWLFFHRPGIPGQLIRLRDGATQDLGLLKRGTQAAFSPKDPRLFLLSMQPGANRLSFYRLSD